MTALKAHEVERFVKRPDLAGGIILLYGPDAGLVRESAQRLVRHFAATGDDFGLVTLDGQDLDSDADALLVAARTPSLFGGRRVVRVRGASKTIALALSALGTDAGDTIMVLEAANLAPRDALRVLVEGMGNGRALPCYADTVETIRRVIGETFAAAGIAVEQDVIALLADTLGNDREITRRELEKLVLYADESKVLGRADVDLLCADNAAFVLDQVADAIGAGHAEGVDIALSRALAVAVNPQQLLAAVSQHFSQLRRWRSAMETGASAREVLDGARPKPHFSRRNLLEQQLRLWSDAALATATERLLQVTADSRKSYGRGESMVRRAFLSLAQSAAHH